MAKENKADKAHLRCPCCDEEIAELQYPYCDVCKVEIFKCTNCHKPVPRENKNCPACGAEIRYS